MNDAVQACPKNVVIPIVLIPGIRGAGHRVTDELAAGAKIAAGAVTMKAPGGQVVGGLAIASCVASYADASR